MTMQIASVEYNYQQTWDNTNASITEVRSQYFSSDSSDHYKIFINYSYETDSGTYKSEFEIPTRYPNQGKVNQAMEQYQVGQNISIVYSPHHHGWSIPESQINEPIAFPAIIYISTYILTIILSFIVFEEPFNTFRILDLKSKSKNIKKGDEEFQSLIREINKLEINTSYNPPSPRLQSVLPDKLSGASIGMQDLELLYLYPGILIHLFFILYDEIVIRVIILLGLPSLVKLIISPIWLYVNIVFILTISYYLVSTYGSLVWASLGGDKPYWNSFFGKILNVLGKVVLLVLTMTILGPLSLIIPIMGILTILGIIIVIGTISIVLSPLIRPIVMSITPNSEIYTQVLPVTMTGISLIIIGIIFYQPWLNNKARMGRAKFSLKTKALAAEHYHTMIHENFEPITSSAIKGYNLFYAYDSGRLFYYNIKDSSSVLLKNVKVGSIHLTDKYGFIVTRYGKILRYSLTTFDYITMETSLKGYSYIQTFESKIVVIDQSGQLLEISQDGDIRQFIELDQLTGGILEIKLLDNDLYILTNNEKLIRYDIRNYKFIKSYPIKDAVSFEVTDGYIFLQNSHNILSIINQEVDKKKEREIEVKGKIRSMKIINNHLVIGLMTGQLQIQNLEDLEKSQIFTPHIYTIEDIIYSNNYLATVSLDGSIKLFEFFDQSTSSHSDQVTQTRLFDETTWITQTELREQVYCYICMRDVKVNETYVRCVECYSSYHKSEIKSWLNFKSICPVCRQQLKK